MAPAHAAVRACPFARYGSHAQHEYFTREGPMTLNIDDAFLWQVGENIDRLITIDVMSYGVIGPLFEAARAVNGGAPLCLSAAARLIGRVKPGATVLLTTGFILPG